MESELIKLLTRLPDTGMKMPEPGTGAISDTMQEEDIHSALKESHRSERGKVFLSYKDSF